LSEEASGIPNQDKLYETALKLEARAEVENLMGRYAFMLTAGMYDEICGLFTQNQPDVRAEMNWGVYEGYSGILRCYANYHKNEICGPGVMAVHALTTPVIEVAGDHKTAKAVWVSPGNITGGMFSHDKVLRAYWAWMRYGCDFIYEDVWKIWHLHVYGLFMSQFDKSWTEQGDAHEMPDFPPEYAPDRPPTYSWAYSANGCTENVPAPPKPYMTFDRNDEY